MLLRSLQQRTAGQFRLNTGLHSSSTPHPSLSLSSSAVWNSRHPRKHFTSLLPTIVLGRGFSSIPLNSTEQQQQPFPVAEEEEEVTDVEDLTSKTTRPQKRRRVHPLVAEAESPDWPFSKPDRWKV